MIDKLLVENIEQTTPDQNVAVLLSGGVDSISVALAAERLGKTITAYSFCLDNEPSYDYNKAKEIAKNHNWAFVGTIIDTTKLEEDFYKLVSLGCKKKTHYECVYPFLHVYPKIAETYVLSGWAADGYYGVSKKANIHYKHTKEKFDEFRDNYFDINNQAGYLWHELIARNNKKQLLTPYLSMTIKDFFYNKTWEELNKPFQKHHVVNAFEEFKKFKFKKHINLQLGAGVDKLFETLIDDKFINFKFRKRVMDICRDWSNMSDDIGVLQ